MHIPEYVKAFGRGYAIAYLFPIQFENSYTALGMIRDSTYLNDAFSNLYIRAIGVMRIEFEVGSNVEYRSAFIAIGS